MLSRKDSTAIAYAQVVVSDKSSFAITNKEGFFSILVSIGDTVLFSAVQCVPRGMYISRPPTETITVWMRPRVYELPELYIYPKDVMRSFYTHKRIDYDAYHPRVFTAVEPRSRIGGGTDPNALGVLTIDGLLSSLLLPFTLEYRQMEKLHELRRKRRLERYYENLLTKRLSVEFVQSHLLLSAEEVRPFLDFWKPEVMLLEIADEYALIEALQAAKEAYIDHLLRLYSYRSYYDRVTTFELREVARA